MPRHLVKYSETDYGIQPIWEFDNATYYVIVRKDNHYFHGGRGEWHVEFELAYAYPRYSDAQVIQSAHGAENCYVLEIRKM